MSDKKPERRDFLFTASYAVGAVGVAAVVWPLVDQMNPDASVKALASTEVDVSSVKPGNTITVLWRGKPVFIRRRTQEEISEAKSVKMEDLKHPEKDEDRAKDPQWLVMLGVCTHLGCVPLNDKGDYDGWFCPCHGSHYDTSGRIRKGPAPLNMEIPKYEFVNANTIKIGYKGFSFIIGPIRINLRLGISQCGFYRNRDFADNGVTWISKTHCGGGRGGGVIRWADHAAIDGRRCFCHG